MGRRLPVYFLIDTSGSMKGEPLESVKVGIDTVLGALRQDPYALETVWISFLSFDRQVKVLQPLRPLDEVAVPRLTSPDSGPTMTGMALNELCRRIGDELRAPSAEVKGDWMPILFLMTDGKPSDTLEYESACRMVKKMRFSSIIGCAAGPKANTVPLRMLTDYVYSIESLDSSVAKKFFIWVSDVIAAGGRSIGSAQPLTMPAAPPEVNVVI